MAASVSAQAPGANLDLAVTGLRNNKGNVLVCLTANPKAFPDCSKDPNSRKATVAAINAGHIHFEGLSAGTWAVSLIHDENGNGKLDTAAMIPREGFGFSRNPRIGFGPPRFTAAAFTIGDATTSQSVKMRYML